MAAGPAVRPSVLTGRLSMSVSHLIKHVVVARLGRPDPAHIILSVNALRREGG